MEIPNQYIKNLYRAVLVFVIILSLFFVVRVLAEWRSYGMMGSNQANTITLSGHGEVTAVPDIASVYFTISKDSKTAKEAQDAVVVIEKKALDFLKTKSIDEKDIKAENVSVYPKYDYVRALCPQMGVSGAPEISYDCGGGKQVLTGYTASESITVKIKNIDDAGAIVQGLGTTGVSNISGPNFTIENEDSLKAQARKEAIEDAKTKAEALVKDLGVKLGRIANFSEGGNYYPMYAKSEMMDSAVSSAPAPAELPKGENTISSDVTITYEIR